MKPKINYKFYEKLLKKKYKEHERAQPLQYSYFEEFRDSLMELLEQAFQDGLNACSECAEREERKEVCNVSPKARWPCNCIGRLHTRGLGCL